MKHTKECPKCQSMNIVRFDKMFAAGGGTPYLVLRTGGFSGAILHLYICGNCGYSETWFDREDLPKIMNSKHASKI